ncbi:MAG: DUF2283 domain-containing protein [Anaerolineae bacterium]|nr:DUF2283 domain-containing protein [Anaerolineae bacterium]
MTPRPWWLIEFEITLEDGTIVHCDYDKEGDILELFFRRGPATCTVELTDNIILRFDRENETPLSLGLISYSALSNLAEIGPYGFRLKLDEIREDVRQTVLKIITTWPVNRFLKVLTYFPPRAKRPVPITFVERMPAFVQAQRQVA